MDAIFTYATIVYVVVFLALGILLLVIHIPHEAPLEVYRKSCRVFACAYLLLGIMGLTEFFSCPADGERNYVTIYNIGIVSLVQAWLNTYAYLLLQEPSRRNLRRFRRYASIGLPLIILAGGAMTFFPGAYPFASVAIGVAYAAQIYWTIGVCFREYRANARAMENYYDGTLRYSWMNGALVMTLGLALVNLAGFYIDELSLPLRVATTLFYIWFAIRLLDYVHVFIRVGEAHKEDNGAQAGRLPAANGSTDKLAALVALWCDEKRFCRDSLTIKTVAQEIGTNHTYLSAYLNRQLGCSFQQWLNTLRIEEAKALFKKHPDRTITQIGRMVGITQPYNFSRWFKQITGRSPLQWKKRGDPVSGGQVKVG